MLRTHAENNFNRSKRSQPQNPAKEAGASFPFKLMHTKHSGQHGEGRALITKQPKCSLKQNLRDPRKLALLTGTCRSTDRLVRKPNQPRILSTSFYSWHSMSNAVWQLRATFATSQPCEKREVLSPDPCNPMTYNASLLTLSA